MPPPGWRIGRRRSSGGDRGRRRGPTPGDGEALDPVEVVAEAGFLARDHEALGVHLVVEPAPTARRLLVIEEGVEQAALGEAGIRERGADREIARSGALRLAARAEALDERRDLERGGRSRPGATAPSATCRRHPPPPTRPASDARRPWSRGPECRARPTFPRATGRSRARLPPSAPRAGGSPAPRAAGRAGRRPPGRTGGSGRVSARSPSRPPRAPPRRSAGPSARPAQPGWKASGCAAR